MRWFPWLAGVLITLAVTWWTNLHKESVLRQALTELAIESEDLIEERFQRYEYGLRGMRGAVVTAGPAALTRRQLDRYAATRDTSTEFPGALGFGYIRRVPAQQVTSFLAQARADGAPEFDLRQVSPHQGERFVIQYIYPLARNRAAQGLDIASEANRRRTALDAARTGQARLTAPITLVQADGRPRRGFLILLPVYASGVTTQSPQERQDAAVGWSYAPLVIDDVLADLGRVTKLTSIDLAMPEEGTPFYRSGSEDVAANALTIRRDIQLLGQRWVMTIGAKSSLMNQLNLWSPWLVFLVGLSLTAAGSVAARVLTQSEDLNEAEAQEAEISWRAFLHQPDVRRSWTGFVLLGTLVLSVGSWVALQDQLSITRQNLAQGTAQAMSVFQEAEQHYRRDVLFLAKTPPIEGLMLATANGKDPRNGSSSQQLRSRLANIFEAYALATPNVHQVRLIEAATGWRESIRVQREGSRIETWPEDRLQVKAGEPYIDATLQLADQKVFVSDINLNREFGEIERPHRPVWRFSTPIRDAKGQPFAILIINLKADVLLRASASNAAVNARLYITNDNKSFLLHPQIARTFGDDLGTTFRWDTQYRPAQAPFGLHVEGLSPWQGESGSVLVQEAFFVPQDQPNTGGLHIFSVTDSSVLLQALVLRVVGITGVLTALGLLGAIWQYYFWSQRRRQQIDLALQQSAKRRGRENDQFRALMDSAPEATVIVGKSGAIEIVNAKATALFGYTREQMLGQNVQMLLPQRFVHAHQVKFAEYVKAPVTGSKGRDQGLFARRADGTEFPVELNISPVQAQERLLIAASIRDMTEQLAVEESLRRSATTAEQATRAKSAFLANMSHEIRTPLNAIIGLTSLLADDNLSDKHQKLVSNIQFAGRSLLGIVNDVLDLSKIEANEMQLELRPVLLPELLEEVAAVFEPQVRAKGLSFRLSLPTGLPKWCTTDSTRLRQILTNLLSNALKFTAAGEIALTATLTEPGQMLRLCVKDTGIGISKEAQHKLFQPFSQADESTTRKFGGTGLGLSIVRKLADLLGAKVGVDSVDGSGSEFWVQMPLQVPTAEDIARFDSQSKALSVLIAEDVTADATHLEKLCRALGWRPQVVSNGVEMIKAFLQRRDAGLRLPDVLLVDWQMPEMDGLSALYALAKEVGPQNIPSVLVISAFERDKIETLDPNHLVGNFLQKPVGSSELFNAVNHVVIAHTGDHHRVLEATKTEAVKARWLNGVNVLVVDDSTINLEVVSQMLERNGAIVSFALDGEEAVELIRWRHEEFDVVLMDIQMPKMGGLEATQQIRDVLNLKQLPVIALTAGALLQERQRALAIGMNDFLTKPIDPSELISRVRVAVEAYRGRELVVESLSDTQRDVDEPPQADASWPVIAGLNPATGQRLLMGDVRLFHTTLERMLTDNASLLTPPEASIDDPNQVSQRKGLADQVHKLRSASGALGAEKLYGLASQAEELLRSPDGRARGVLSELSGELARLEQASAEVRDAWRAAEYATLQSSAASTSPATLPAEALSQLHKMLLNNDMDVLELVMEHRPALNHLLGSEKFARFEACVQALNFIEAKLLLDDLT